MAMANIIDRLKQLEEDNNNYKAAAIINDRLYQEVCNKNKELEEEKARYEHKYEIAFNKLIEYEKTLEKLQKETIWKSLIKEKKEETANKIKELEPCKHISPHDYGYACGQNEILRELLGDEK